MSFRDVKKTSRIRIGTRVFWWRHAPEAWAEICEKAVSWVPASERESRDSELGEARRICALRAPRVGWVESWRYKSSRHRKIFSLSPHVEKSLNSKRWIKVSYLNQFSVFGFLYMFMNILWTLCLFHTSIYLSLQHKERIRIYFKIRRSKKIFVFFLFYLFCSYIRVIYMYVSSLLIVYSMRLELTLVSSINGLWLVRLGYIVVSFTLSWSVFTLVCFPGIWYMICL